MQRQGLLATLGCAALMLGVAVYQSDRSGLPALHLSSFYALAGVQLFGALGAWLPSFVHPFAFSLLTVAALPVRSAPRYGVCAAWCGVNLLFEAGQHPALHQRLAAGMLERFGSGAGVRFVADYFRHGTFDVGDLAAAILGGLAAAAVLRLRQLSTHAEDTPCGR